MIVCHCGVVSSRDIAEAWDEGARSVEAVCRRTSAAQKCGTCLFSIQQIVCQHERDRESADQEAVRAAS